MASSAARKLHEFIAMKVYFEKKFLCVVLADGREVKVPLEFYPRLIHAAPAQCKNYQLIGQSQIHWPDIDEDLSTVAVPFSGYRMVNFNSLCLYQQRNW